MPQSQSCIFNTSNPTACLETPPQSPNKKSMSENSNESTTSTTESETGKTTTTNTTSKAPATPGGSSKPKWKPLLIDAPKRERKSYRPSQGNNSTRSSYRNKDNNNNNMNTSTDENTVSSKRSNRAKSLDRHQDNDSNDKNSLPVNDTTNNQNGEANNKSRSKQSNSKSNGSSRLNKSMTESTSSSKNFTSKSTSQDSQRPVQRNFNGAPTKGNGYRGGSGNSHPHQQQQYTSLPIQRQNGNGKSNGKRETHKDYLYGEDSIIVEEVPVLMPLAPNGMYHQGIMPMLMHPMEHQSMIHQTPNAYNVHSNEHSSLVHQPQQPGMFYNPMYTEEQTKEFVRHQIEYYFSDENLQNDLFLRKKMDMLGYIPLSVIADFNRVKSLSQDFNQIVASLAQSDSLEITPIYDQATGKLIENYLVRCKSNPTKWPMHSPLSKPSNNVSPPANLNPFVPEFVPSFGVSGVKEKEPAATAAGEKQKSKPVTITKPSFERMLSSR